MSFASICVPAKFSVPAFGETGLGARVASLLARVDEYSVVYAGAVAGAVGGSAVVLGALAGLQ